MPRRVLLISHVSMNILFFRAALIKRLRKQGWEVHVAVPGDERMPQIEALGAITHPWKLTRGSMNPLTVAGPVRDLRRIMKQVSPHVAHSFTHQPNIFARLARPWNIPLTNSVTGLGSTFLGKGAKGWFKKTIFHQLYRFTSDNAAAVIFQNNDDREHFRKHGMLGKTPVRMVRGSGVDVDAITPDLLDDAERTRARAEFGIEEHHVVFAMAARLIRDKGVFEFLEAAKETARNYPDARFLLVGDVDPANPTSLTSDGLKAATAEGNIIAAGWRDDMPRIWAISDVAVLPSYREGLPVTMQEALASGLPVITTDAPGCRDIVGTDKNGLLVPAGNAPALANAMQRLAHDADLRKKMGRAGRNRAEQRFNADTLARETIDVYEEVATKEGL